MPRLIRRRPLRWGAFAGAAGALLAACVLTGCPGDIDPSIMMPASGSGGSGSGTGGGSGNVDCSGANAGDQIVMNTCAQSSCHSSSNNILNAGLDMTLDSNIGSRLVGVMSKGQGASLCGSSTEPYLVPNVTPATGLLIDKLNSSPPCGVQMPELPPYLTAAQTQCFINWATTIVQAAQ
jgi:hypothetical protein